ncbi:Spc19-domain-containing protein, partial [Mucor lusitanicus]
MSNYPKRPKTDQNDTFKRPHSSVEDLRASTQSLSNILEILDTSIKRLDQETAEFSRQTQLSLFDRPYELVTENDISIAQAKYGDMIDAELSVLIQDADKVIQELGQEEQDLIAKTAEKQKEVDELIQLIEITQAENAAKKSSSTAKPKQAHSSLTPQQTQELRKLENEKARLDQLLAYEDRRLAEKTATLIDLQKKNLETEKRLESEKKPTPGEYSEYEQGLLKQIDYYTNKIRQKKEEEEVAKQRLQQEHEQAQAQAQAQTDTEADQDQDQQDIGNVPPLDAAARYRELLDMIEKLQKAMGEPDFRASEKAIQECEAGLQQCYNDIQQEMAQRKAQQPSQIERLKRLFQVIIPDQTFARTAGRIVELLYVSDDTKLPLQVLQKEFPEASQSRHKFKNVVYWLVSTHIADYDGTHIIL